jgi:adenylosuccinate lyase
LYRIQRWLDVEADLAACQAELEMIPGSAADEIARAAQVERLEIDELPRRIAERNHSLVPLLELLEEACRGEAGQWVHYGATTQDIQDTAQILEMREVLDAVETHLVSLRETLATLAQRHRETLMVGRTHGRPALPTTFGLKVAGWTDELDRHLDRLEGVRERVLVVQLFGGVGTMAEFSAEGEELLERFADRLGLAVPRVGWHTVRDRVAEYIQYLATVSATLARVIDELRTLSGEGIREVVLGWEPGSINSSTMPHKRNPESCEQVVVLARLARQQVGIGLDAVASQEHERDSRGLRLEWAAVADVSHYTLAALKLTEKIVDGVDVDVEQMKQRALELSDRICSEALMLALAEEIGKQKAHRLVYELSQKAREEGTTLKELASGHREIRRVLTEEDLEQIFEPSRHLGRAPELVDGVV